MKNTVFDFKAAGYESLGDWSRLWDLLPRVSSEATQQQNEARATYEAGGQKKALFLALLATYGVSPPPHNAETAATRNVA